MADYVKPPITSVPFVFSTKGYQIPLFNNVPLNFTPTYTQAADLQSTINVMQLYQDSTYTYLKGCRKIVVGFGTGIQVIQLPCEYGGIRDIGSGIYGNPEHRDLASFVLSINLYGSLDSYIRGMLRGSVNLGSFIHPFSIGTKNLGLAIKCLYHETKDIPSYIRGWLGLEIPVDLSSNVETIPPVDLASLMNIIDVSNLPARIAGEWWHGSKDLYSEVPSTSFRNYTNLKHVLHSWQLQDLNGFVRAMWPKDLGSYLNGGTFGAVKDLGGNLGFIAPVLLQSIVHGWDTKELNSYIKGSFGPGDLFSNINAVLPKDISSYISGYKEIHVAKDLLSRLTSFYFKDLNSYLNCVTYKNLGGYLNSSGGTKDLTSNIIPKVIYITSIFNVSLLEHLDLSGIINTFCYGSAFKDLGAYTYALHKKDLKASIIGWYGNQTDNIKDLSSYINSGVIYVEDRLDLYYSNYTGKKYSELDVFFSSKSRIKTLNGLDVVFTTKDFINLYSYVSGELRHSDLTSRLNSIVPSNFTTLPEWVNPKTREVFINLNRFENRVLRFVDLMFDAVGNDTMQYFYVADENKVYKSSKNRKWTIWFTGYSRRTGTLEEKYAVRRKILFNLSEYSTIDEAVRDLMTQVAEFNASDLNSQIMAVPQIHSDLNSEIFVKDLKRWYKSLNSQLVSIS